MDVTFEADPKIGELFEAYSLDCIDLARMNFGLELRVDEPSIQLIEQMAGALHNEMPPGGVPEEVLTQMEKMLGSHIAQVLITTRSWEPGIAVFDDGRIPAVRATDASHMIWPWAKAHNRIVNGPEDNLWHYYQAVTDQLGPAVAL